MRIATLGLTHDHVWSNLEELASHPTAELVAVADPNPPLTDKAQQLFGCQTYDSYEGLLQSEELDAVYLFSDNASNVFLLEAAAERGLHALVEKPMASSLDGADTMMAAARRSGIRLMINWPFCWWPQLQQAITLAQAGEIGTLWQVKYRAAHAGPEELGCSDFFCDWLFDSQRNGAGALMDYCCYGALLARVLLGQPSRVTGFAGRHCKENITVEDNAMLIMEYARGQATSEGSWTQIGELSSYVTTIYGTAGTLLVEPRNGGRLLCATEAAPQGVPVDVPTIPSELHNATNHFVHCLQTNQPFMDLANDRLARDAQEILEAGLQSVVAQASMSLPLH